MAPYDYMETQILYHRRQSAPILLLRISHALITVQKEQKHFNTIQVALDLEIDDPESLPSLQVFAGSLGSLTSPYDYMETGHSGD